VHAVQRRGLTENLAMAESCVLVIGGGAAGGLLAAHLARYGRRVILAERSSGPHDKVCGEFLSEEVARSLSEMGIDLAALGAVQISAVRLHEGVEGSQWNCLFALMACLGGFWMKLC
jgi:heterodisulfide reductase subunit A-like polyferredoxin